MFKPYQNEDYLKLKQFYAELGYRPEEIERIFNESSMRDLTLVQTRFADYQKLFQADLKTVMKIVYRYPRILGLETLGDKATSLQHKIRDYQNILHIDEAKVVKMMISCPRMVSYDCLSEKQGTKSGVNGNTDVTNSVKTKITDLQEILQTDEKNVTKMMVKYPAIIGMDINANVAQTLAFYRDSLQINQTALTQILAKFPGLLGTSIDDSPTSAQSRIEKISEVMPMEKMRELVLARPAILTVPAQNFKVRYMLASNASALNEFFGRGFLLNQKKVWGRWCFLTNHSAGTNSSKHSFNFGQMNVLKIATNLYRENNVFENRFNVKMDQLVQDFPLDMLALTEIERTFQQTTGSRLTLNNQEITAAMK